MFAGLEFLIGVFLLIILWDHQREEFVAVCFKQFVGFILVALSRFYLVA